MYVSLSERLSHIMGVDQGARQLVLFTYEHRESRIAIMTVVISLSLLGNVAKLEPGMFVIFYFYGR